MKKISFGSFPFINIDKKTRTCLDKYLIKSFADQIVTTDIFANLNTAKDFFYLTPEVIINQLYNFNKREGNLRHPNMVRTRGVSGFNESTEIVDDNFFKPIKSTSKLIIENGDSTDYCIYENNILLTENNQYRVKDPYVDILKRGFLLLRNFYKKISSDPFYRDVVYLPVYSEKLEVLNPSNMNNSQYKYSFFILTNDLTKNLRLDEVSFNESAVVNALYIFTQLFPGKKLTEFNEKDLDKLLRIYKFFEEYKVPPIQFFTMMYRLFYLFSKASSFDDLKQEIMNLSKNPTFAPIFNDNLIKALMSAVMDMKKIDFDIIYKLIKKLNIDYNLTLTRNNEAKFWKVIETILNNKGIMSLIRNTTKNYSDRLNLLKDNFKFRDIIIIFEDLVQFNKYNRDDILKDSNFELNFKLELNNENIVFNDQIIKRKLDETFGNFLKDADSYVKKLFEQKTKDLVKNNKSVSYLGAMKAQAEMDKQVARYRELERQINDLQIQLSSTNDPNVQARLSNYINSLNQELQTLIPNLQSSGLTNDILSLANSEINQRYYNELDKERRDLDIQIANLKSQLASLNPTDPTQAQQIRDINLRLKVMREQYNTLSGKIKTIEGAGTAVKADANSYNYKYNDNNIGLKNAKTELGELYETIRRIFMNPTYFNLFLKKENLSNPDEFLKFIEKQHQNEDDQLLATELADIDLALNEVVDVITENFLQELEAFETNKAIEKNHLDNNGMFDKFIQSLKDTLINNKQFKVVLKARLLKTLCLRVCKIFTTTFKRNITKGEISFKETTYGLHPLIKKLLKNPNNFKSMIFGFDELINLYDLLYITNVEKYLMQSAVDYNFNTTQRIPIKLTQVNNKINHILDTLGIKNNPVWIISRNKIFLSLPDFISLTRERIFNSIPKEDIQNYCKIHYDKIWNEMDFGSTFGGKQKEYIDKMKKIDKQLKEIEKKLKNKQDELKKAGKDKSKKAILNSEIKKLRAELDYLVTSLKALRSATSLFSTEKNNFRLLSGADYI